MFLTLPQSSSDCCALVLAPHTDDGEFACGGTIVRLLAESWDVKYVAFSSCEESVPDGYPKDILQREVQAAVGKLGIPKDNLFLHRFPVRRFPEFRQDILEVMVELNQRFSPTLVLLPSTHDTHQDHNVISTEGFRAFKKTSILGYELPWNNLTFSTQGFVVLEETHLRKKIEALKCYESQAGRGYANESLIRSLAMTRGTQIGCQYAEVFEIVRWIMQ